MSGKFWRGNATGWESVGGTWVRRFVQRGNNERARLATVTPNGGGWTWRVEEYDIKTGNIIKEVGHGRRRLLMVQDAQDAAEFMARCEDDGE